MVQGEVRAGSGLHRCVHRKPELVLCACLTWNDSGDLQGVVWWCNQQEKAHNIQPS